MKIKINGKYEHKETGRIMKIISRANPDRWWNITCEGRRKSHKTHEGTIRKYYKEFSDVKE